MNEQQYIQATVVTGKDLRTIAYSDSVRRFSSLSLPEIDALVDLIAQVAPAGNVPGVILNGLVRLPQRQLPPATVKRDIRLLFRGVEQALKDKAVYGAFFAGPAAVIWAYQNLLKLAGKDPDSSFPEGTWQFYVDYALRDDTARHACETHGLATTLGQHKIQLSEVDKLTAWAMTAVHCLHQYDDLLENEWRERVFTFILQQLTAVQGTAVGTDTEPDAAFYAGLYRRWEGERPYRRGHDVEAREDYPAYRRRRFDQFLAEAMRDLSPTLGQEWQRQVDALTAVSLPAYQKQMDIRAYLEPGQYGEARIAVPKTQLHVGIIHQGRYYLLPACLPASDQPAAVSSIRAQIAALIQYPAAVPPADMTLLAGVRRAAWGDIRATLSCEAELDVLRLAPIWINGDERPSSLSLSAIRRTERGIGDHPLTIFLTPETAVFDQSHIFFDGAWGVALAEILTNEALAWAAYLHTLPPAQPGTSRPHSPALQLSTAERQRIHKLPSIRTESSAETAVIDLRAILKLRRIFKQRSDLLQLTVNDLLLLYRAIHAATYQPHADLLTQLRRLQEQDDNSAAAAALMAIEASRGRNPVILIPVDASGRSPGERLYPLAFSVPLDQLDLIAWHRRTLAALDVYEAARGNRHHVYDDFQQAQRAYLGALAGLGGVLQKAKGVARMGESASVGSIKMMAYMPAPVQRLLDKIPGQFDVLNDLIKGREVFSNVGAVAADSTLTRFMTAKDDNEKKTLAWAVLTTAEGVMVLTLRDFRPHVALLTAVNQAELAARITQDYLDAYAYGLNAYVADLQRITEATPPQKRKRLQLFGNA
jgi:hypothetical protein